MVVDTPDGGRTTYRTDGVVGMVLMNLKGIVIREAIVLDCSAVAERTHGPTVVNTSATGLPDRKAESEHTLGPMVRSTLGLGRKIKRTVPGPNSMLLGSCALRELGLREIP
jgi:hypothetical protein